MNRKIVIIFTFVSSIISCSAFAGDDFHYNYLNDKTINYSNKIIACDNSKITPKFSDGEINTLRRIISEHPLLLAYLSVKSYNACLQPERGELAEVLLSYQSLDLPPYTLNLAKSAQELAFTQDYGPIKSYQSLSQNDQKAINAIIALQQPFHEFEVFESIMGMEP